MTSQLEDQPSSDNRVVTDFRPSDAEPFVEAAAVPIGAGTRLALVVMEQPLAMALC
jgi:hypothetical protein